MRTLVVDDHQDTLDIFSIWLQMLGHEVQVLADPTMALATALEFLPDIVFLDIEMPVMDGCEVARRMRQHKVLDSTFLAAVTGHGREQDRQRVHAAGFDIHLLKPVDLRDLKLLLKRRPYPAPRPRRAELQRVGT